MSIQDLSDQAIAREIKRREQIKQAEETAKRKEADRIYNLPENVAKRKVEHEAAAYKSALYKATQGNSNTEDTYGIWKVYGEDSNCDMGGHHHEPFLGKVKGSLKQAIQWAVKHPRFFTWGGGGRIEASKKETIIDLAGEDRHEA